jgi:hypothetical protein
VGKGRDNLNIGIDGTTTATAIMMAIHSLPILSPQVHCEPVLMPSIDRLDNQGTGVDFWLGQEIFLSVTTAILALRPIQLPTH